MICLTDLDTITVENEDVAAVYIWQGDTCEQVWSKSASLAASAFPQSVGGAQGQEIDADVSTNSSVITVEGGHAPFTYAWSVTDGGGYTWTVNSPSGQSSSFTAADVPPFTTAFASIQCLVTDARGSTATVIISARATNYGGLN